MVYIDGVKYACETCIRGHRVTTCAHKDRPLTMIKPKGRPVSQCPHCREARRNHALHTKCDCPGDKLSAAKVSKLAGCQCPHGGKCDCSKLKNSGRAAASAAAAAVSGGARRNSRNKTASVSPSPDPPSLILPAQYGAMSSLGTHSVLSTQALAAADSRYYQSASVDSPFSNAATSPATASGSPTISLAYTTAGATTADMRHSQLMPEMSAMFDDVSGSPYAREFYNAASSSSSSSSYPPTTAQQRSGSSSVAAVSEHSASRPSSASSSTTSIGYYADSAASAPYVNFNPLLKHEVPFNQDQPQQQHAHAHHHTSQQQPEGYSSEYNNLADLFSFSSAGSTTSVFSVAASLPTNTDFYSADNYPAAPSSLPQQYSAMYATSSAAQSIPSASTMPL
ncbi:copper fist DNA binding domain-containing protein [Myxozyma melibiosi]|uniref:Copper fist DNA binding domain-containing protein n=1 Tax=Myxozyma melibiosi TaxID=54550 RepID=A0ABR1F6V6_9ASCO